MSSAIARCISLEPDTVKSPPPALDKHRHGLPDLPTAFELRQTHTDTSKAHDQTSTRSQTPYDSSTPPTPSALENSRPPTPQSDTVGIVQTLHSPPINKWRVMSACAMGLGQGLNDAAPGALIPYMEKRYHVNYAIVSLIFVANAIGFVSAAPSVQLIQSRLGRSGSLTLSLTIIAIAYIMMACNPPFPVVVIAFLLTGFGLATNLALNNTFCASLANNTTILGLYHGAYGLGGTTGPLIATALVTQGRQWSTFYFIALGLAVVNIFTSYYVFRNYERDTAAMSSTASSSALNPTTTPSGSSPHHPLPSKTSMLKESLRNRTTLLGALFIFAYQGAEVSISGWVISFLISYRHSSPTRVGYVTSGFWGGITLGRFLLSHPSHRFGEKRAVVIFVGGAAGFQLLVWLVPNVVGEAVAVSIVGLLLGPVYPCATAVFSRLIPGRLLIGSLATVSALGSSGGAVAPFFTGLLAQEVGTWVLHPICIALFGAMVVCWLCLPRLARKGE